MSEDFLTEKEFNDLKEVSKWNYVSSLYKLISQLKIQAEKNCEECEKQMLDVHDLNIDYLFEDWRSCSQQCDECGLLQQRLRSRDKRERQQAGEKRRLLRQHELRHLCKLPPGRCFVRRHHRSHPDP